MSTLLEMAEAYEAARREPDPMDRAAATTELARLAGISTVRAKLQGEGAEFCDECGIEIPVARRKAAPWATLCVECANIEEQKLRNAGGSHGRN
jgi:phage/conjugal plasmid C-4 type zinc finger TraR family protein